MLKSSETPCIHLQGVRHNNLKNFDLDLPLNNLIVVTGLSGSGKSSLAFDTLFAEGQRRYIETFSPYARQFLDRMDKPQVDSIQGIPPAIAIEQRNSVKTTRSTVGTMTEICDYMKLLWPHIAKLHCRQCGRVVSRESPSAVWESLLTEGQFAGSDTLITFSVPLSDRLSLQESLSLLAKQGYQRILTGAKLSRIEEVLEQPATSELIVVQDRIRVLPENRSRFVEACEQAYHFGKGRLSIYLCDKDTSATAQRAPLKFSCKLHCARCDIEYKPPTPALFSFNHPVGACPKCRGFGRVISIDYQLAVPDWSKTLRQGVVRPWQTGTGAECQADMLRMCRELGIPIDVPFAKLPKKWQDLVIEGEPDYGKDEEHEWPRAWYGVKGYFRWLESKAYKMHVRVLLSRYRAYTPCPDCSGTRFQPESLLYRFELPGHIQIKGLSGTMTLPDFYQLPIRDALKVVKEISSNAGGQAQDPMSVVLPEVRSRLGYLNEVGLGYLTLDRPTRSLSGGETERVNLTGCLGTRLVNTLFVLDEPSVGLHPRDTDRLVRVLEQLRDTGNTVVVVEHEERVMRAADQIVDLGPGHGASGGEVVFQGTFQEIQNSTGSLTGEYLSGRKSIEVPERRPVQRVEQFPSNYAQGMRWKNSEMLREAHPAPKLLTYAPAALRLSGARKHNLQDLSISIPLQKLVCVTGLSGSGKTTLVREVLLPLLQQNLRAPTGFQKASDRLTQEPGGADHEEEENPDAGHLPSATLEGFDQLDNAVLVDQSILGKTPRSNPAVYIGAFDHIRDFFAGSEPARRRGLNASAFSFNSAQGQCDRCRGAGYEKIEMQFLSDVFIRCPDCNGRRYRKHILDIKVAPAANPEKSGKSRHSKARGKSIADLLESTVEEALEFLSRFPDSRPAQKAMQCLRWLSEVGLGYMQLGQPINTLSGGESQRLKLVRHLAEIEFPLDQLAQDESRAPGAALTTRDGHSLFLFDEPTTGLHFEDVRILLTVLQRLVDAGHSVIVIEHNLDVIKSADWVIDLGPGAGDEGGKLVAAGPPEHVAEVPGSHTGAALQEVLHRNTNWRSPR